MKKMIMAAAIVCAAAFAQAAAINWSTGTNLKTPGEDGAFTATTITDTSMKLYVWIVDSATYGTISVGEVWETYGNALDSATAVSTAAFAGKKGGTATTDNLNWTADQDTPVYAITITTLDVDSDGKADWYIANMATSNINGAGSGNDIGNLAKNLGGTGGDAITGWTAAAVPEPTSALMLLVGLAGLALKRKVA